MAIGRRKAAAEDSVEVCLTPGCTKPGTCSRGNCKGCYKRYLEDVNAGLTTWDKLIRKGWTKKAYPPRSPASKALAAG
jgi:hypothetical protein